MQIHCEHPGNSHVLGGQQDQKSVRTIGYCRVSSSGQKLDRQIGALRAEGVDVIYRERRAARA
jgi:predicted site-specific integrase-resolvase